MPAPITWENLPKSQADNTKIGDDTAAQIAAHNDDPDAHLGPNQALESHRAAVIIDHLAGSVVNDKLRVNARRYTAIVDPNSETDFSDPWLACFYASAMGGGDIFFARGSYTFSRDVPIADGTTWYGEGTANTFIDDASGSAIYLNSQPYAQLIGDNIPSNDTDSDTLTCTDDAGLYFYGFVAGLEIPLVSDGSDPDITRIVKRVQYPDKLVFTETVPAHYSPPSDLSSGCILHWTEDASNHGTYQIDVDLQWTDDELKDPMAILQLGLFKNFYLGDTNGTNSQQILNFTMEGIVNLADTIPSYTMSNYGSQGGGPECAYGFQDIAFMKNGGTFGNDENGASYTTQALFCDFLGDGYAGSLAGPSGGTTLFQHCTFYHTSGSSTLTASAAYFVDCTFMVQTGTGTVVTLVDEVTFEGCKFYDSGTHSNTWFASTGTKNIVHGCHFQNTVDIGVGTSSGGGGSGYLSFSDCTIDIKASTTLHIQSSGNRFMNCHFTGGGTTKLNIHSGATKTVMLGCTGTGTITNSATNTAVANNITT